MFPSPCSYAGARQPACHVLAGRVGADVGIHEEAATARPGLAQEGRQRATREHRRTKGAVPAGAEVLAQAERPALELSLRRKRHLPPSAGRGLVPGHEAVARSTIRRTALPRQHAHRLAGGAVRDGPGEDRLARRDAARLQRRCRAWRTVIVTCGAPAAAGNVTTSASTTAGSRNARMAVQRM